MPLVEFNELAALGLIRDVPAYQLPPEAWSLAENVRFVDEGVERLRGWSSTFGTPPTDPHFTMPVTTPSQTFWPYVSLTKAYVWDGTTHTDITRATGGDYTATKTSDWNGTLLAGIFIANNGIDDPQFWATASTGTKLAKLTNWPANTKAKVIRAFGPYLVAINITKSGNNFPHMVKWSHPADPGSVPVSWDETDPTKDTGEQDLADVESGLLVEALPLQQSMYLYKQGSTWRMTYIGGQQIFKFEKFLETSGILGPRCVAVTGDGLKHVVATQDDIIVHNGNQATSILDKRQKKALAAAIDTANYGNSFMFCNTLYNEMWFCYPSQGQSVPNRALIWNYKHGERGAITEADITFSWAISGPLEVSSEETWESVTGTWADDTEPWSVLQRRKIVTCYPEGGKFYLLDDGLTKDGAAFQATIQREALSVIGRKRNGEWIEDFELRKFLKGCWPRVYGGPIRFRAGTQDVPNGASSWLPHQTFDPITQQKIDFVVSGKGLCVEFSTVDSVHWRLDAYKLDINSMGLF